MLVLVGLLAAFLLVPVFRLGTTMRNAGIAAIAAVVDQGAGAGKINFFTGSQPGSVGGTYGTLLGTVTFSDPAFGSPSTGTVTASAITSDTSADASGTCTCFNMADSSNNVLSDGTCGTSGTDIVFDNNVIVAGGVIAVSSLTMTQPIS